MQISLKWVNELVDIKSVNLNFLIEKLTLSGFEVEEISKIKVNNKEIIRLDISATANRADSLSIQGISLEIAALLDQVPKISNYSIKTFNWKKKIQKRINSSLLKNNCSDFICITVENLNNLTSPNWLKQKLLTSKIIPENNLNDFQNYIVLETGYPFEFYDLDKITSKVKNSKIKLTLTSNPTIKNFIANNGILYKLDNSILTVNANDFPISIAGIISNKQVEWSKDSKSILIEGSIFNAVKIRRQSRVLGLRTNRSSKYEKSLNNTNLVESFYRLISLLKISNPNLNCKLHTIAQPIKQNRLSINLTYKNVKAVLGPIKSSSQNILTYITPEKIASSLSRLNFKITSYDRTDNVWKIVVPNSRIDDIVREIDLIEEIGRMYGFNNFLTRLPIIKKVGIKDSNYKTRTKLTSCLIHLGFNELVQYSLVDKTTSHNNLKLINPLIKDYSTLRSTLLPSLLRTVQKNLKKSNLVIEGFEYGHVFSEHKLKPTKEKEHIAGIFGAIKLKSSWSDSTEKLTWFEAKGRLEELFKKLNIIVYWKLANFTLSKNIFNPYCAAELYLINNRKLGKFGQINSVLSKQLNILSDVYLFEFDFEVIQNQIQINKSIMYQPYSSYPRIIKDLSFIIDNKISFQDLKQILYLNGSKFLRKINLLDKYYGVSVPENHTSLCLQLVFQSDQKTLENKKVEIIVNNLKLLLSIKFNVIFRA